MKLAILIPTTPDRKELFDRLLKELNRQIEEISVFTSGVTIIANEDNYEKTTGAKRNSLIQSAIKTGAQYIAFFDSDDMPGPTYIKRGLEVAESGLDCGELWGQIYFDGKKGNPFHHSITHNKWSEDDKFYYRMPNHLNFLKLDKIKGVVFPHLTQGEDYAFSKDMLRMGILKTQYNIPEIIYHYYCGSVKHEI